MTNQQLIHHLQTSGILKSEEIKKALEKVPREEFVPPQLKSAAYDDHPLPIGEGQTISQPTTVVFMLELLEVQNDHQVLEIGAGSGWQTALLAELTGPTGQVSGFEILSGVGKFGQNNLAKFNFPQANYFITDAQKAWEKFGPYDRIISGAAFTTIPKDLKQQLKIGGRLVTPTQENDVRLIRRKDKHNFEETTYPGFIFVPIVH